MRPASIPGQVRPSPRPRRAPRGIVPGAILALALATSLITALSATPLHAAPPAASAAAVLAASTGQVSIERPGSPAAIPGTIGMRLLAGDTVRVGTGASATVYLAGGGLVRVPAGSRIEIPREAIPGGGATPAAAVGATPPPTEASSLATAMSSRSVEVLEAGLWILNDPDGSVLLSAMRGEGEDWGGEGGGMEPLSPRFEMVFETRPRFVWSGPSPARVVVARGREILWRGPPSAPGNVTLPPDVAELKHGEVYRWWLESEGKGTPPTESVPFRIAERRAVGEAARFEKEVEGLATGDEAPGLASLLRCGYYVEVGAWSRVVAAAADLRRRDPGSTAAERALEGSRRQMRLGTDGLARLAPAAGSSKAVPAAPQAPEGPAAPGSSPQ